MDENKFRNLDMEKAIRLLFDLLAEQNGVKVTVEIERKEKEPA